MLTVRRGQSPSGRGKQWTVNPLMVPCATDGSGSLLLPLLFLQAGLAGGRLPATVLGPQTLNPMGVPAPKIGGLQQLLRLLWTYYGDRQIVDRVMRRRRGDWGSWEIAADERGLALAATEV
jgi:hypothetical protein